MLRFLVKILQFLWVVLNLDNCTFCTYINKIAPTRENQLMKQLKLNRILFLLLYTSLVSYGQQLTLSNIENICTKSNWDSVNQFLMKKNWEYYESKKGDSEKYSTITWSYEKSYEDKAEAWFYLYTFESFPNKISYSVFNKSSYSSIQNALSSKGYKLKGSEIADNKLISTYANSKFILKITTEKRKKDNFNKSITAYQFLLIKKSSIYDPDNGKKTDYYYGKTKQAEYTMLNGKMNGSLKVYYKDGQLKKIGNYKKGLASGNFIEYDKNGNKTYVYNQSNDKKNGKLIYYKNNKISYSTHYTDDIQNGEKIEYYYNKETERLYLKTIGQFLNGEKNGLWKLVFINEEKRERILTVNNYSKGIKDGFSQDIKGDSLIIANYSNNKLNGNYKIYLDVTRAVLGGVIETDTSKLSLISDGNYSNGQKSGYWKNYSLSRGLSSEGNYSNNSKTGEWKYYYSKYINNNKPTPYSEKLYLIENYSKGKLNGLSKRFSYLNKKKYKCSELDKKNQSKDSCTTMVHEKILETSYYKNNKMNGLFELRDSLDILVAKGNFKNNQKNDKWFHRYNDKDHDNNPYHYFMEGSYINNRRDGKWILYYNKEQINKTINYSNGQFNGKLTEWNKEKKPKKVKLFDNGELKELIVFDSIGQSPKEKFEIFEKYLNRYKCRYTQYNSIGKNSQVYWLKKDKKINHNWFKYLFLLKLKKNDESLIYKNGEFTSYDLKDRPLIIGEYLKENKVNNWTYYYYHQNIRLEIDYDRYTDVSEKYFTISNELFSGEFTFTDNEQKTKEVRSIKNGVRHGKTVFIDLKTGKKIKKVKYKGGKIK